MLGHREMEGKKEACASQQRMPGVISPKAPYSNVWNYPSAAIFAGMISGRKILIWQAVLMLVAIVITGILTGFSNSYIWVIPDTRHPVWVNISPLSIWAFIFLSLEVFWAIGLVFLLLFRRKREQ